MSFYCAAPFELHIFDRGMRVEYDDYGTPNSIAHGMDAYPVFKNLDIAFSYARDMSHKFDRSVWELVELKWNVYALDAEQLAIFLWGQPMEPVEDDSIAEFLEEIR